MARKLKTYQTSQGFYDLAIAAPSMKAALEAWGANSNLFHQGFASETDDPKIVAATMAKPGIVLRRPVGTKGAFSEHSELPTDLGGDKPAAPAKKPKPKKTAAKKARPAKRDDKAERAAALAYEKEQRKRDAERRKQQAIAEKQRRQRARAVEKAQAAYDKAEREHEERTDALLAERDDLEKREKAEEARWQDQRERLRDAVRKAGG